MQSKQYRDCSGHHHGRHGWAPNAVARWQASAGVAALDGGVEARTNSDQPLRLRVSSQRGAGAAECRRSSGCVRGLSALEGGRVRQRGARLQMVGAARLATRYCAKLTEAEWVTARTRSPLRVAIDYLRG